MRKRDQRVNGRVKHDLFAGLLGSVVVGARQDHAKGRAPARFRRQFKAGVEQLTEPLDDRQTDALSRLLLSGRASD